MPPSSYRHAFKLIACLSSAVNVVINLPAPHYLPAFDAFHHLMISPAYLPPPRDACCARYSNTDRNRAARTLALHGLRYVTMLNDRYTGYYDAVTLCFAPLDGTRGRHSCLPAQHRLSPHLCWTRFGRRALVAVIFQWHLPWRTLPGNLSACRNVDALSHVTASTPTCICAWTRQLHATYRCYGRGDRIQPLFAGRITRPSHLRYVSTPSGLRLHATTACAYRTGTTWC